MFVKNILIQNLVFFLFREVNTNVSASICNNIPWNNIPKKFLTQEKSKSEIFLTQEKSKNEKFLTRKSPNPENPWPGKKIQPLKKELPFCR